MCRLFGLHSSAPVTATFWLLDSPDNLARQSRTNPDGAGIGAFDDQGRAVIDKAPIAAWADADFASDARTLLSTCFVAHVRYASTGGLSAANTHPFCQDGRIFAHNGAFGGLDLLQGRLVELDADGLVEGETDSERMFALITAEIRRHDGDVGAGLTAAVRWISDSLPVHSLNLLLATHDQLWALRHPATNELHVLERAAGGHLGDAPLDARSQRIHARAPQLADRGSLVVASEPMDADPGWRLMESGELLHVGADGTTTSSFPFPRPVAV